MGESKLRKTGRVLLALTSGLVLLATVAAVGVQYWMGNRVETLTVTGLTPVGLNSSEKSSADENALPLPASPDPKRPSDPLPPEMNATDNPAENILVIGSDSREGQGGGFGDIEGQRSDTTMLIHLSEGRDHATVLSIPRDLWVPIPACGEYSAEENRFNAAFSRGGINCTIETVKSLTRLDINRVIVVDFQGFKSMVDAVGGLNVCIAHDIDDPKSGLKLKKGVQVLNGKQALALARARYTLGDGSDISRIGRQQEIFRLFVKQLRKDNVFSNPVTMYSLANSALDSLSVDESLNSVTELVKLGTSISQVPEDRIEFITWPFTVRSDGATVATDESQLIPILDAMSSDNYYSPNRKENSSTGSGKKSKGLCARPIG